MLIQQKLKQPTLLFNQFQTKANSNDDKSSQSKVPVTTAPTTDKTDIQTSKKSENQSTQSQPKQINDQQNNTV